MKRVAIFCPGRGSYTEQSLGSLVEWEAHPFVKEAERLRREYGLEPLLDLDRASRFRAALHLRPANVAALIYVVTMLDTHRVLEAERVVCIGGNSMGWYTALAVGGALSFEDGFRLVQEMALFQEDGQPGGQIIYPAIDADWQPAPDTVELLDAWIEKAPHDIFPSIRLGGFRVLAGTSAGLAKLLEELPKRQVGKVEYPFRLAQHGPYHTPLAAGVSERARESLNGLSFDRPKIPLIDGRGQRFTPWSTDAEELREYTLGAQVTTPYDFTASVEVGLCEYAPERIVLPGPGNTLGGICGQILLALKWRGLATRADFDAVQKSEAPILESMRR